MDGPAIRLEGLVKSYGDVRALDGIDLVVPRGEVFGFLGPNGAGKTTAIRILMDLIRPTAGRAEILECAEHFRELLRVRRSTRLFRLRRVDDVQRRLRFPNSGPDQLPGVLVFTLDNSEGERIEDDYAAVLVVLNARREPLDHVEAALKGTAFRLHPVLAESADPPTRSSRFETEGGRVRVPGRTTAVFVLPARR